MLTASSATVKKNVTMELEAREAAVILFLSTQGDDCYHFQSNMNREQGCGFQDAPGMASFEDMVGSGPIACQQWESPPPPHLQSWPS